jgi:hypothetical protein
MSDEIIKTTDEPRAVESAKRQSSLTAEEFLELDAVQRLVLQGDVGGLTKKQQIIYIKSLCDKLGINWESRPFQFIPMNGKTVLYATRDCADQLRAVHQVSIQILERVLDKDSGIFYVRVRASLPNGREDESMGAVGIYGKGGEELANALMKAETKAKRRATYSIVGLGLPDETEVLGDARPAQVQPTGPRKMVPPSVPMPDLGAVKTTTKPVTVQGGEGDVYDAEALYVNPHLTETVVEEVQMPHAAPAVAPKVAIPVSPFKPKTQPLPPAVPPIDIGGRK